jgi:hypothetical protein
MQERSVILRNTRDASGWPHLEATLRADGALSIEGQDLGAGVAGVFGADVTEHEWAYSIAPEDVQKLAAALGSSGDVLDALAERFSVDAASGLKGFLDESGIPYEMWVD